MISIVRLVLDAAFSTSSVGRLGISTVLALTLHGGVLSAMSLPLASRTAVSKLDEPPWLELDSVASDSLQSPASAPAETNESRSAAPLRAASPPRKSEGALPAALPASQTASKLVALEAKASDVVVGSVDAGFASGDSSGDAASPSSADTLASEGVRSNQPSRGAATGARLLGSGDPCPGYFPASSTVAKGTVQLTLEVDARGVVGQRRIVSAEPRNAGFSQAALACASRLRFKAATDDDGRPLRSTTTLVLHFERP